MTPTKIQKLKSIMDNSNTDKQSNKTQPTTEQTNKRTTTSNHDKQQPTSNNDQQQVNQLQDAIDPIAISVAHHAEPVPVPCVLR